MNLLNNKARCFIYNSVSTLTELVVNKYKSEAGNKYSSVRNSVSIMSADDTNSEIQNNKGKLMKQLDNYIIVDVGANLTNKKFSRDLDAVIQRAKDAGKSIINKLSRITFEILIKMLFWLYIGYPINLHIYCRS